MFLFFVTIKIDKIYDMLYGLHICVLRNFDFSIVTIPKNHNRSKYAKI